MNKSGHVDTGPWEPLDDFSPPVRHTPEETRIDRPGRRQLVDLSTFVAPERSIEPRQLPAHQVVMDIDHPARQGVILHTSAVDRANGFQRMITPIAAVLAILAVIVSLAFTNELFTFASLLIFWLTFAVVYVLGWALTALVSAEFVSLFSAWRQWNVIDREQAERWQHYRGQAGPVVRPWYIEYKPLVYAGAILSIVLGFGLVLFAMVMWG